jgi:glycosyltransferase involved in cell wall biosynthesis
LLNRRVVIATLWYYPSHFGRHVDDFAAKFVAIGYEVTILTVAPSLYGHDYFDPFRGSFVPEHLPGYDTVRLDGHLRYSAATCDVVFEPSGGSDVWDRARALCADAAFVFCFFDHMLPWLLEIASGNVDLFYAGDFVARATWTEGAAANIVDRIVDDRLGRLFTAGGRSIRGLRFIFTETHSLATALQDVNIGNEVRWLPQPVAGDSVKSARPVDIRRRFGIPERDPIMLFVGRAGKNSWLLPGILLASRELMRRRGCQENLHVVALGPSPEDVDQWQLGASERPFVHVAGFSSRSFVYGVMKTSDLLVHLGSVDGYPKAVREAGVAGLAVVGFTSPASGIGEFVTTGRDGLLVPFGDIAACGRAIDTVLGDAQLRRSLAREATSRERIAANCLEASFRGLFGLEQTAEGL